MIVKGASGIFLIHSEDGTLRPFKSHLHLGWLRQVWTWHSLNDATAMYRESKTYNKCVFLNNCNLTYTLSSSKVQHVYFHYADKTAVTSCEEPLLRMWGYPRYQDWWGQPGAHLGTTGPRWAPCWSQEPCHLGRNEYTKDIMRSWIITKWCWYNALKIFNNILSLKISKYDLSRP